MNEQNAFYATYKPTLGERLTRCLFPRRYLHPLSEDQEAKLADGGFAPGELMTTTVIALSWPDRLRVLASGKLRVDVRSATDVLVSKMQSRSETSVLAPWERLRGS